MGEISSTALPPDFVGLPWDVLHAASAPVPRHLLPPDADLDPDDRWLLYFHTAPDLRTYAAACANRSAISLHLCPSCHASLMATTPKMPPLALSNGNWIGEAPPVLQSLTDTERLFIARGFTVLHLKHLQHSGDPGSRQRGLVAGCIAFPQNNAEVFNVLPHRAHVVAEYLSVQFTDVDFNLRRSCPALYVRRAAVAAALRWLQLHNEHYAHIVLDPAALADLPDHAVPEIFLSPPPSEPLETEALPRPEGVRAPATCHI